MKRLWRPIFNVTAVLSLALCVATCVLWRRGQTTGETFVLRPESGDVVRTVWFVQCWSFAGTIRVAAGQSRTAWPPPSAAPPCEPTFGYGRYDLGPKLTGGGVARRPFHCFAVDEMRPLWGKRYASLDAPAWSFATCFALIPAVAVCRRLRGNRVPRAEGHRRCLRCGYNLTANVSGVCPECGTKVTTTQTIPPRRA